MTIKDIQLRKGFTDYVTGAIDEKRALSLGLGINNGKAFVPTVIADEIIGYLNQENLLRKYGKVVKVENNLKYPVLTAETDIEVTTNSDDLDDSNTFNVNKIGLTAELLEPVEFNSVSIVSKKLLYQSGASASDLVIDLMKEEYLKKEIGYMYNGTELKSENTGSLYNKAKLFTPTETEPVKIIKELKNTPSTSVMSRARWIINKEALKYVEDLVLPNGEAVIKTLDNEEGGAKYLLLGYPADVRDEAKGKNQTAAVFYFGDFSSFVIQENEEGLQVETKYEMIGDYELRNEIGLSLYNLLDGKLIYSEVEPTIYKLEILSAIYL